MIYILVLLALIGLLPLVIVLIRKNRNNKLRKYGVATTGTVSEVYWISLRGINLIYIEYKVKETGETITKQLRIAGMPYSVGDVLPLFYDKKNPRHMQLDMKKGFAPMLIFTIFIAIFIIWTCFKMYEMVVRGEM